MPCRKRTRIWTNLLSFHPHPLCRHGCPATRAGTSQTAQRGSRGAERNTHRRDELCRVPRELVEQLMDCYETDRESSETINNIISG